MKFGAILSKFKKTSFFIMHLSYDGDDKERLWNYAKDNELIGLDAPRYVVGNWCDVRDKAKKSLGSGWIRQFDTFCDINQNGIHKGDIVMIFNGMKSVLGVAQVKDVENEYSPELSANNTFFDHVRDVEWVRAYDFESPVMLPQLIEGFSHTLSRVSQNSPRWSMLTNLDLK